MMWPRVAAWIRSLVDSGAVAGRSPASVDPSSSRPARRRAAGQASVELVALLPLVVLAVAAAVQVLAAGTAHERASAAAEAGAVALLQATDAKAAVESALGGAAPGGSCAISGQHVRVSVRPRALAAPLSELLEATSTADAGEQAPAASATVVRGGDGDGSGPRERP